MTIEELEILVRANVTDVKSKIQEMTRDVKKAITETIEPMKKMNQESKNLAKSLSPSVNQVKNSMNDIKDTVKSGMEETRKILIRGAKRSIQDFDFSGAFKDLNTNELQQKMEEIKQETDNLRNSLQKVYETEGEFKLEFLGTKEQQTELVRLGEMYNELYTELSSRKIEISVDTTPVAQNLDSVKNSVKSFDMLTVREQIKSIYDDISNLIPVVGSFGNQFKQALNDNSSLLSLLKTKMAEFGAGVGSVASSVKGKFQEIKGAVSEVGNDIKTKMEPVANIFNKIGITGKQAFNTVKAAISDIGSKFEAPISKIKQLLSYFPKIKKDSKTLKNSGNDIGNGFSKGISKAVSSVKRFALSLVGIQSIWRGVSKAASAYLSFDQELNESFQNSWNTLGSLLAPALEFVASLFAKVTSYVAAFVKALTGVDLVARANAKSLSKQASATKSAADASRQLSGIDDLNNMTTSDSGSDGGSSAQTISVEPIDDGIFDNLLSGFEKIKEVMLTLFEPFQLAWENYGQGFIDSFMNGLTQIGELGSQVFGSIMEVWTSGLGQEIIENIILGCTQIFDIIGLVAEALSQAWNENNTGSAVIENILNVFKEIQRFCLLIGDSVKKWVMSEGFQNAIDIVLGIIKDISYWISDIAKWIVDMYEKYVKPIIDDKIIPLITSITEAIKEIWKVAKPIIDAIIKQVKTFLEPVIQGVSAVIGGIIDVIRGIIDFVVGVFTGNWKKAWNGIKTIFGGIIDAITGVFKGAINILISVIQGLINFVISAVNAFLKILLAPFNLIIAGLNKIPGVNIKKLEVAIPKVELPKLATGNVATSPVVAEFGEYPGASTNPEITSPVSIMADTFRNVLSEFGDALGGTRVERLTLKVLDENFFDGAIEHIKDLKRRKGVNVLVEE